MAESDRTFLFFRVQGQAEDAFRVVSFTGSEGISSLFRFDLELATEDHDIDFQSVLGKAGRLRIVSPAGDRHAHGIVSRLQYTGGSDRFTRLQATLVPEIWKLGLGRGMKIFQETSVPDIVKKVLKDAKIPDDAINVTVHRPHEAWEYCVQYRESDLSFISRLMEQEGIFYFFESSDSDSVLRIGDDPSDHPEAPDAAALPFRPTAGMAADEETVTELNVTEEIRPDAYAVTDYYFKDPDVDLSGKAEEGPGLGTEVFEYPGEYEEPDEGSNQAKVRLQELRAGRVRATGASGCPRLTPGHTFEISGHMVKKWNMKYLVLNVQHQGTQPQVLEGEGFGGASGYSNSFTCIPADVPYRPPRVTPRPSAQGVQSAVVVGKSGQEIDTDEFGRIRVQFHWDREGKKDENSTCWIRVAQSLAGPGWGSMFIPRIGQEVIVGFLDGDPDQPIVTGCVYNQNNKPPYALPDEQTKTTIKTNSSLGGGGYNELRFEDAKGSEEIFLHGQKDWNVVIENDESDSIGANRTVSIGKNENVSVGESRTESVEKNEDISIGENRTENVGKNERVSIGADRLLDVSKNETRKAGENSDVSIGKDSRFQVGKNQLVDIGKKYVLNAGDQITLQTGGAKIVMKKSGSISIEGKKIDIKASGNITLKGSKVTEN